MDLIDLQKWVEDNKERFIEISDKIWQYAELGLFEEQSVKMFCDILKREGFDVKKGIAGLPTAFIASYGTEGPIIGVLAEYDALPGLSQRPVPRRDPVVNGAPGHGCGHNLFGTACLAAVLAIKEKIDNDELKGTIRFYGCPAEENADGKGWLVKEGAFEDVDIVLTWHPGDINGVISVNFQSMVSVVFTFRGKSAHAAGDPWNGRSALDAVELMNIGCNYLREHMLPSTKVHYIITDGGRAPNIVPETAEVWYYIRGANNKQVKDLFERVSNVAKGAALMTDTQVLITILGGSANILSNYTLEEFLYQKMSEVNFSTFDEKDKSFAEEIVKTYPENYFANYLEGLPNDLKDYLSKKEGQLFAEDLAPIMGRNTTLGGSTDVGDVSWVVPLVQFTTACFVLGTPGHSWQLVAQAGMGIGHKGMISAAKTLAITIDGLMTNTEVIDKAKGEFKDRLTDNPYISLIPPEATPPIDYFRNIYKK